MFEAGSASGQEQVERVRPNPGFPRGPLPAAGGVAGIRPEDIEPQPNVRDLMHRRTLAGL